MHAVVHLHHINIHLVLLYLSIPNTQDDRKINWEIKQEVEKILDQVQ